MKEETRYGKHKQPIDWYQSKLVEYIKANHPEKLKFNPTVIIIQNNQLTFGMEKHYGRLVMSLKIIDDFHTNQMKKVYPSLPIDSQLIEQIKNLLEPMDYEENIIQEKINSSKTKDIRIAIPCPWGPTLRFIELKDWVDCDVHEWLSQTHLVVRTSKEDYKKVYRFKLEPIK